MYKVALSALLGWPPGRAVPLAFALPPLVPMSHVLAPLFAACRRACSISYPVLSYHIPMPCHLQLPTSATLRAAPWTPCPRARLWWPSLAAQRWGRTAFCTQARTRSFPGFLLIIILVIQAHRGLVVQLKCISTLVGTRFRHLITSSGAARQRRRHGGLWAVPARRGDEDGPHRAARRGDPARAARCGVCLVEACVCTVCASSKLSPCVF